MEYTAKSRPFKNIPSIKTIPAWALRQINRRRAELGLKAIETEGVETRDLPEGQQAKVRAYRARYEAKLLTKGLSAGAAEAAAQVRYR